MSSLAEKTILVLRPEHQAAELAELIADRGGLPVTIPAIEVTEPDSWAIVEDVASRVSSFDWIVFTSINGVGAFLSRVPLENEATTKIAAIGPSTERALHEAGVTVEWVPSKYTTATIASEFPAEPCRVLVVRAEGAPTALEEMLIDRGFEVERVNVYQSVPVNQEKIAEALRRGDLDAVALTSASIAASYSDAIPGDPQGALPPVFCIGPETAAAAEAAGITVAGQAEVHTIGGLVTAMEKHFQTRET